MPLTYTTGPSTILQIKFPLTPHPRGWCKKINGKTVVICGHISPELALQAYHQRLPQILVRQEVRVLAKAKAAKPAVHRIVQAPALVVSSQLRHHH